MNVQLASYTVRPATVRTLGAIALAGVAVVIAGLFPAPARIWPALLVANYYVLTLGLAGVVFVALMFAARAGWSTVFRRIPEAMSGILPVNFLGMLLMVFGLSTLYEWTHQDVLATDALLAGKAAYLNIGMFMLRMVLYFAVWLAFAMYLRKEFAASGQFGRRTPDRAQHAGVGVFLVLFALTFWLAGTDWIMSIEAHWFSTIFGVYNIAGMLTSGIAAITLLLIVLRRRECSAISYARTICTIWASCSSRSAPSGCTSGSVSTC